MLGFMHTHLSPIHNPPSPFVVFLMFVFDSVPSQSRFDMDSRWSTNFDTFTNLLDTQYPQYFETYVVARQVFFDVLSIDHHRRENVSTHPHSLTPQSMFPYMYPPPSYPY